MNLTALIMADLESFDIETWLAEMEVQESVQEDLAVRTCQNFLDEISALCH